MLAALAKTEELQGGAVMGDYEVQTVGEFPQTSVEEVVDIDVEILILCGENREEGVVGRKPTCSCRKNTCFPTESRTRWQRWTTKARDLRRCGLLYQC